MSSEINDSKEYIITHQIWKGKKMPEIFNEYRNEWLKMFPHYKHMFHKDDDLRNLIKNHYPDYLVLFDSFQYDIERIDFFRCAMLHHYGGVYIDLDVLPIKPLDMWIKQNKIVLGHEPDEHIKHWKESNTEHWEKYREEKIIGNAIMISPKGDNFWIELMNYIKKNYIKGRGPVLNTGPYCISRFITENSEYNKNIIITDSNIFYPATCGATNKTQIYRGKTYHHISKNCDIEKAYAIHLWTGSWKSETSNLNLSNSGMIFLISLIVLVFLICIMEYVIDLRN